MADVKISALPAATTPLAGTEVLPIVQSGATDQVSVANLTAGRTVGMAALTVDANSASAAVRITQTGAGNALLVEDSASTDSTPFVVDASGNVGVGAASPTAKLDVIGPSGVTSFTGTTRLGVATRGSTAATDYSGVDFIGNNQTNPVARIAVLTTGSSASLSFGTSNNYANGITNTAVTIDGTGKVGVGTTAPTVQFEVQGGATAAISGQSSSGYGVKGASASAAAGIFECSGSNIGVYATSVGSYGVDGRTSSASSGGVIGFSSNTSYYGILGYQATYGGYFVGTVQMVNNATVAGLFYNSGHGTTASAANTFINSSSGLISRSTSSLLYKKDVEPLWDEVGDKLLQAKPIFYRSNELTEDNPAWSWYSFGAEELAKIDPRFVLWGYEPKRDENGKIIYVKEPGPNDTEIEITPVFEDAMSPNGIHTNALLAAAVNLIQRQHARIEALEARVAALETPKAG